jgi:hypothetical protein
MTTTGDQSWFRTLKALLDRMHLMTPDRLATVLDDTAGRLGLHTTVWLVDYDQTSLRALPQHDGPVPDPIPVDGSLPGRAFASVRSLHGDDRWWVPIVDGTDRLGVIEFVPADGAAPRDREFVVRCELLAGLIGHLIGTLIQKSDHIELTRRSRPMSVASELLWRQLPPLTSSCEQAVVTAIVQPCYDVGGDGFDYALESRTVHLVVLDAMGRGLQAGLACAVALAAIRATRRAGRGMYDQARAADAALVEQFPDSRFATAVIAELDLDTGRLRYLNAGHPQPLLLRGGRLVRGLPGGGRMPLGVEDPSVQIAEEMLEPDDRLLLYTDGVTEARASGGDRFGLQRLVELVERHAAAGLPAPETLRRLAHAVIDHQAGPPADDATLVLLEWSVTAALNSAPKAGQPAGKDEYDS